MSDPIITELHRLERVVELHRAYVKFLEKQWARRGTFCEVHGFVTPAATYRRCDRYRAAIDRIEQ